MVDVRSAVFSVYIPNLKRITECEMFLFFLSNEVKWQNVIMFLDGIYENNLEELLIFSVCNIAYIYCS